MNMERGYTQSGRLHRVIWGVRDELPRMGVPGSRSALLHQDFPDSPEDADHAALGDVHRRTIAQLRTLFSLRWLGTIGALLIALGGLGAGALPVVGNPYESLPFGFAHDAHAAISIRPCLYWCRIHGDGLGMHGPVGGGAAAPA